MLWVGLRVSQLCVVLFVARVALVLAEGNMLTQLQSNSLTWRLTVQPINPVLRNLSPVLLARVEARAELIARRDGVRSSWPENPTWSPRVMRLNVEADAVDAVDSLIDIGEPYPDAPDVELLIEEAEATMAWADAVERGEVDADPATVSASVADAHTLLANLCY